MFFFLAMISHYSLWIWLMLINCTFVFFFTHCIAWYTVDQLEKNSCYEIHFHRKFFEGFYKTIFHGFFWTWVICVHHSTRPVVFLHARWQVNTGCSSAGADKLGAKLGAKLTPSYIPSSWAAGSCLSLRRTQTEYFQYLSRMWSGNK